MSEDLKAFDLILEDLKTNNDWHVSLSDCTLRNLRNNVQIWVANIPILNTGIYKPTIINLSLWQKYKLYKAVQIAKNNQLLRELGR
jgi:hypothetical protein